MDFRPGYRGFLTFAREVADHPLQPFQRRIVRAHFGAERELVAVLPRGSAKSSLAALIAVHHLLTVKDPGVYIGAASRDQARIIGGMVRALVQHPDVRPKLIWRPTRCDAPPTRRDPRCCRSSRPPATRPTAGPTRR